MTKRNPRRKKKRRKKSSRVWRTLSRRNSMIISKRVRLSSRLLSSPACLVADEYGMSASMERLMRSMQQDVPANKRILEINPNHALIQKVKELAEGEKKEDAAALVKLLYNQSVIAEGGKISNPGDFVNQLTKLMEEHAKTL